MTKVILEYIGDEEDRDKVAVLEYEGTVGELIEVTSEGEATMKYEIVGYMTDGEIEFLEEEEDYDIEYEYDEDEEDE